MTLHTRTSRRPKDSGRTSHTKASQLPQRGLWILAAALLVSACAGVNLKRTDGAHKYRALPLGTPVIAVESAASLQGKFVELGQLQWVVHSSRETPDLPRAKAKFLKKAARFGCDVIANIAATSNELKSKKKVKNMGEGGTVTYTYQDISSWDHTYSSRCIRTAKAPGGLIESDAAAPPTPTAPVVTPVLTVQSESTGGIGSKGKVGATAEAFWDRLAMYKTTYLLNWKDALGRPPEDEMTILEAFAELMVQVTGPTGFWQRKVGAEWFGCPANPAQEQCKKLAAANTKLAAWHRLQASVGRQSAATAHGFINAHQRRMIQYLEEIVPARPNLSGMQQTPFYMQNIR